MEVLMILKNCSVQIVLVQINIEAPIALARW